MSYHRRLHTHLARLGQDCDVYVHAKATTSDAFNNPDDSYTFDRTVTAVRTYPDDNDERKGTAGDLDVDTPLFIIPRPNPNDPRDDTVQPPGGEDRLVYDGVTYAIQGLTVYETHVEATAERVTN